MPFALLLAMQASGMVVDWLGTRNQADLMKMGQKINQAGLEANLELTRVESADASLQAMKNLRKTIGSQAAVFAARGTRTGVGSALTMSNELIGNFSSDERMRRMNLLSRENALKAGGTISKLNQNGETTKLWNQFSARSINRFPSSKEGWELGWKDFKEGFGLTKMGNS